MDRRDRTIVRLPDGLRYLVRRYQSDRNLTSFSATIVELLETHPAIAERVRQVYAEGQSIALTEGISPDADGNSSVARLLHGNLHCHEVPDPGSHDALRQ